MPVLKVTNRAMHTTPLPPAIFLMGPTASGKTDLAVELTRLLPCDIISADSALIYTGMDIGTAKPDTDTLAHAPHRLISFVDPAETYSAAAFRRDALQHMADITAQGRIPLIVGGTMLYFKILRDGIAELPAADPDIRQQLSAEATRLGWPAMHARLAEQDPESAAKLHPNHSQRILRALEVYAQTGTPLSVLQRAASSAPLPYRLSQLGLLPIDRSALEARIKQRLNVMLDNGLVDEVKRLHARGDLHTGLPSMRSVGYRQVWDMLEGQFPPERLRDKIQHATMQLAKRQITWLRSWPELITVAIHYPLARQEVINRILKTLSENAP